MKTLEQIRQVLWFPCPPDTVIGPQFRLNEQEWKRLMQTLDEEGYAVVPKELVK
jgi:hypothetical protein